MVKIFMVRLTWGWRTQNCEKNEGKLAKCEGDVSPSSTLGFEPMLTLPKVVGQKGLKILLRWLKHDLLINSRLNMPLYSISVWGGL